MGIRVFAAGVHFFISLSIALVCGALVFFLWYPPPFASFAGGLTLFMMLVGVDVILGPCLTALVAAPTKSAVELRRDIGVIVVLQALAFSYGMYTIALARPVYLVFEVDRIRVITAVDVDTTQLGNAAPAFRQLPWTGPTLIAAQKPSNSEELLQALDAGLQGVDIAMQPKRWVDYETVVPDVLKKARSVKSLMEHYPAAIGQLRALAAEHGVQVNDLLFLPMQSRRTSAVALIAPRDARILGYLPFDGFF
jgi:hypothetical protein